MADVTVYGADWCGMTRRSLAHLDQLGVAYQYINVEADARGSQWVKAQSNGREKKPTIDIAGRVLVEPTNSELEEALREQKMIA